MVLAPLSRGYPTLEGRLFTCYSPVCHFTCRVASAFSFDLHVLGTPSALILSQDQTLQFDSKSPGYKTRAFGFFGFPKG